MFYLLSVSIFSWWSTRRRVLQSILWLDIWLSRCKMVQWLLLWILVI